MNNRQEDKLSMFLTVDDVCESNKNIWSKTPAFVRAFNKFKEIISKILTQQEIQKGKTTGITENKQKEEDKLIQTTLEFASSIHSYAALIGDNKLKENVNYSPTDLKSARDTDLRAICQSIHKTAESVISELADYGKTPEDLDKLQKAIDDFSEILSKPRSAIGTRATATSTLQELFKEGDELLRDHLDMIMVSYKTSHPTFYNMYRSARTIVDMGRRSKTEEEETELDDE
jgi:hypothetical protein